MQEANPLCQHAWAARKPALHGTRPGGRLGIGRAARGHRRLFQQAQTELADLNHCPAASRLLPLASSPVPQEWSNWSGLVTCRPEQSLAPASEDEVAAIVRRASA